MAKLPTHRSLEDWQKDFDKEPIMNRPVAAAAHVINVIDNLEKSQSSEPLESLDGKPWTGLRISHDKGNMVITPGYVSTTSERNVQKYNAADLHNIYVHMEQNGHITITTAVITTPLRAEEFMQAVIYALTEWKKENPDKELPPIHIGMHQLNSHGVVLGPVRWGEVGLIEDQHRMATYINARLPEVLQEKIPESALLAGPYVIHKNHAINPLGDLPQEPGVSQRTT